MIRELMSFLRESWEDISKKDKICVILFFPFTIFFIALAAHSFLSEKGCIVSTGMFGHIGHGIFILIMGICTALLAAALVRAIISLPGSVEKIKRDLVWKRKRREIEYSYRGPIVKNWGAIGKTTLVVLIIAIALLALGGCIGYIAWLLVC
jgi:hypothetical protein